MEAAADLRVWTDTGQLMLEPKELKEFRAALDSLHHLCNVAVWTGGKFQGSFFGAENIELVLVVQDSDEWIACDGKVTYCKIKQTSDTKA